MCFHDCIIVGMQKSPACMYAGCAHRRCPGGSRRGRTSPQQRLVYGSRIWSSAGSCTAVSWTAWCCEGLCVIVGERPSRSCCLVLRKGARCLLSTAKAVSTQSEGRKKWSAVSVSSLARQRTKKDPGASEFRAAFRARARVGDGGRTL